MTTTPRIRRRQHERPTPWVAFVLVFVLLASIGVAVSIGPALAADPGNGAWWAMAWVAVAPAAYAFGRLTRRLPGDAATLGLGLTTGIVGVFAVPFAATSVASGSVAAALVTSPFVALFLWLARRYARRIRAGP